MLTELRLKKKIKFLLIFLLPLIYSCAVYIDSEYVSPDTYAISSQGDEFSGNFTDKCFYYMAALTTKRSGNNYFLVIDSKDQEHTSYDPYVYDVDGDWLSGGYSYSSFSKKGKIKVFKTKPKDTYLQSFEAQGIINTTNSEDCNE